MNNLATAYLDEARRSFRGHKRLAEGAIAQVSDDQLFHQLDPEANSIAIVMKHIAGNQRSRFTDFLTTDGEKPDRDRDDEFEMPEHASREEMLRWWAEGWAITLASIEALTPEDLDRRVSIRGEAFLVPEALSRSATHTAYHVGQIVYVARHLASPNWKSLSIPKGQSAKFATGAFKTKGIAPGSPDDPR